MKMIEQLLQVAPIIVPVLLVVGTGIMVGKSIQRDKRNEAEHHHHHA